MNYTALFNYAPVVGVVGAVQELYCGITGGQMLVAGMITFVSEANCAI
jgi:hypothetical protein